MLMKVSWSWLMTVLVVGCSGGSDSNPDTSVGAGGAAGSDAALDGADSNRADASGGGTDATGAVDAAGAMDRVSQAGGEVSTADGAAAVRVPAGALIQETVITIAAVASPVAGALGTVYDFGPDGTHFAQAVEIRLSYAGIALGMRLPSELRVGTFENGVWKALPVQALDQAAKTISALTDHFSPYAIIGPAQTLDPGDAYWWGNQPVATESANGWALVSLYAERLAPMSPTLRFLVRAPGTATWTTEDVAVSSTVRAGQLWTAIREDGQATAIWLADWKDSATHRGLWVAHRGPAGWTRPERIRDSDQIDGLSVAFSPQGPRGLAVWAEGAQVPRLYVSYFGDGSWTSGAATDGQCRPAFGRHAVSAGASVMVVLCDGADGRSAIVLSPGSATPPMATRVSGSAKVVTRSAEAFVVDAWLPQIQVTEFSSGRWKAPTATIDNPLAYPVVDHALALDSNGLPVLAGFVPRDNETALVAVTITPGDFPKAQAVELDRVPIAPRSVFPNENRPCNLSIVAAQPGVPAVVTTSFALFWQRPEGGGCPVYAAFGPRAGSKTTIWEKPAGSALLLGVGALPNSRWLIMADVAVRDSAGRWIFDTQRYFLGEAP
jgi:hypothetical protein